MDLNRISEILRPRTRADLPPWREGSAWLAGGSWLFSEPQPYIDRLIDLTALDWPPLESSQEGLRIAATCTLARLRAWTPPSDWLAARLIDPCCRALLGSFKIWNVATVGGNLSLALPAAPLLALAAALDGACVIWTPDGGERRLDVLHFALAPQRTSLAPGELLRAVVLPAEAFRRRAVLRRASLSPMGRSAALLIGTRSQAGAVALTITAAVPRPIRLAFDEGPSRAELARALAERIPADLYQNDVYGRADWRRHVTELLAEDIRTELVEGPAR